MTHDRRPALQALGGPFGCALTVDVEEWYHTCLVPEYVYPERRPRLAETLDVDLPRLLDVLAEHGRSATFFVLGEVAARSPQRVREIAAAGHEIASHGSLHLRADWQSAQRFRADAGASKARLEDLIGAPVRGFRAPEWSLRWPGNPRLETIAELGFEYDSSLAPCFGAGRLGNPRWPVAIAWPGGARLREYPPLTFGGRLQLPAGGWPGRLAPAAWIIAAALRMQAAGGMPVMVVHPWELGDATPGDLTGFARFVHDTGRPGYRAKFGELLRALPWTTLAAAAEPVESVASVPLERVPTVPMPRA